MKQTSKKFYVGFNASKLTVFKTNLTPEPGSHPMFMAVMGPFRTKRGAEFMAKYGHGNSHIQHVNDAERLAKNEIKSS